MKPATILRIHSIISSALDLAVRYGGGSAGFAGGGMGRRAAAHAGDAGR